MRLRICLRVGCLALSIAAAAQLNSYGVANERLVTFRDSVMVGPTLLPAGEYKVIHTMEGSKHLMLFRATSPENSHAIALVACDLRPLSEPASVTVIGMENEHGKKRLRFLQFKRDTAVHVF